MSYIFHAASYEAQTNSEALRPLADHGIMNNLQLPDASGMPNKHSSMPLECSMAVALARWPQLHVTGMGNKFRQLECQMSAQEEDKVNVVDKPSQRGSDGLPAVR